MKFDSNLAWKEASASISANREVVFALAGVFFLLPGLVTALFFPPPQQSAGMDQQALAKAIGDYYVSILPYLVPMILFQAAGTLGLLTLLTDRNRPTVGEAINRGVKGIIPYILAQLILGLVGGLIGGTLFGLAVASGVAALGVIAFVAVALAAIYVAIKTSLTAPVVAVEGQRNPIEALKRSWQLTKGNSVRLGLFYLLVLIVFIIVIAVVTALVGIVAALIGGAYAGEIAGAVMSAALNAVMALYFVAIVAAAHRQLAGPSLAETRSTFE